MPPRLRPLSETVCYARLYGRTGESLVNVIDAQPRPRPRVALGFSGEELRRMFEQRLDEREPGPFDREEAA